MKRGTDLSHHDQSIEMELGYGVQQRVRETDICPNHIWRLPFTSKEIIITVFVGKAGPACTQDPEVKRACAQTIAKAGGWQNDARPVNL